MLQKPKLQQLQYKPVLAPRFHFFNSFFASYDAMNEYRGDRTVSWKLSTIDSKVVDRRRKWQFSPLTLPLNKWKINFDKPEIHMCKNNCFYRLINKQIRSNHNFAISKVCNMDQEAEIFKPRGTQNNFLTLDCTRQASGSRQPYWKCEQQTWMS